MHKSIVYKYSILAVTGTPDHWDSCYMKRQRPVRSVKMNGTGGQNALEDRCLCENYTWAYQNRRVTRKWIMTVKVVKIALILRLSWTTTIFHVKIPVIKTTALQESPLAGTDFRLPPGSLSYREHTEMLVWVSIRVMELMKSTEPLTVR